MTYGISKVTRPKLWLENMRKTKDSHVRIEYSENPDDAFRFPDREAAELVIQQIQEGFKGGGIAQVALFPEELP